jgi:hypothetical protein
MKPVEVLSGQIWDWISQIVSQHPEPFLAGLLIALTLVLTLVVILFLARFRTISARLRQLHQVVEMQAAIIEKLKEHIDERINSVSWQQQRLVATMKDVPKRSEPLPAALIREELASARMDLLSEDPAPVHDQLGDL